VINPETIKLPVWVIGVGLVHAAAIALVLPMLITLPAPSGSERKVEVVDVELVPAAQLKPKIELDVDQTAALPSSPVPDTAGAEVAAPEPVDESLQAAPEPKKEPAAKPAEESAVEPAGEPAAKPAEEATSQPTDESATFPTAAPDPVGNLEPEAAPATTPVEPQGSPTAGSLESEPAAAPIQQAEPKSKAPGPKPAAVRKAKAGKAKAEGKGTKAKAAKPAPKKPAVATAKPKPKPVYRRTTQDVARKGLIPFKGSWSQLLGGPTPVPAKR
jgi:hypothetical protein